MRVVKLTRGMTRFKWASLPGQTGGAASASYSDVLAAYTAASDGDTINIPAGDVTWSSGITVSKYVKFVGAGAGRVEGSSTTSLAIGTGSKSFTIIAGSTITGFTPGEAIVAHVRYNAAYTMTGTVTSWNGTTLVINVTSTTGSGTFAYWNFEMPASGSGLTKITTTGTAFTFNGSAAGSQELSGIYFSGGNPTVYLSASSGSIPVIHDCRWSNQTKGIEDTAHRGLIYRCYFDQGFDWDNAANNLVTSSAIKSKNPGATNSWTTADTMGTRDTNGTGNLYVEDCFFTGHTTECSDFDDNSRTVWRHCVMDNSGLTSHGQDTSAQGNRHFEVYDNLFLFNDIGTASSNMNYCVYWRGGAGIVIDNTMPNVNSTEWGSKTETILTVQQLRRNAGPNACWNSGWPSPRQPGQGHNGSSYITEGCFIRNNASGVLGLEDYGPDECGGGPSVSTYLQSGRDYFTDPSGASTHIQSYVKYAYPHPWRNSGKRTYSSAFYATENPLSESGSWLHSGNYWTKPKTVGGRAFGTQSGSGTLGNSYDDSNAYLSGTWAANQQISGVVYKGSPSGINEVELLLRWADTATTARGYECLVPHDGAYNPQIVRWNGALDGGGQTSFTYLTMTTEVNTVPLHGDVLRATAIGNQISLYIRRIATGVETLIGQATDSTYSDGAPGIGFYNNVGADQTFGFESIEARDL